MDDEQALTDLRWLAFSRLRGAGSVRLAPLLSASSSLDDFLNRVLKTATGLPAVAVAELRQLKLDLGDGPLLSFEQESLRWLRAHNGHIVDWFHRDYPPLLRELVDPPAVLFCLGNTTLLRQPQIAIVGSRGATQSGLALARMFAAELTKHGFLITSGLAMGIDGCAHQGALSSGPTLAVIGTGLDISYPQRHRQLQQQISQQGLLVSEFPLGAPARAGHFPRRNRLIAGLSLGTLVVEAKVRSGSLITARLSLEAGREVFAIPGSIHNPLCRGPHQLIKQGATLVETTADIVAQLSGGLAYLASTIELETEPLVPLEPQQQALLDTIGYEPMAVDEVVEASGLSVIEVSGLLLDLELAGMLILEAGGYQRLATK